MQNKNQEALKRRTERTTKVRQAAHRLLKSRTNYLAGMLCQANDISADELFHGPRIPHLINLRWVLWRVLRDDGYSYKEIAAVVYRDHSTIVHRLNKPCPPNYEKIYLRLSRLNKRYE